jgi:UDP-3-O-[3-hydroxymyristoyl] N-acetylglucosamine deacetylase
MAASAHAFGLADGGARSQHTLRQPLQLTGIGLHSGKPVQVQIEPAPANTGRVFVRVDLPDCPVIPATVERVGQTILSTELVHADRLGTTIRTTEHLLAGLVGMGVDNARIAVDGEELPILDGSALPWVEAIAQAGVVPQAATRSPAPRLSDPVTVSHKDAFVSAIPAPALRFTYGIEFAVAPIGQQWCSWSPQMEPFGAAIAPARTFGLAQQVDELRSQGLIQGGSLDNALVCDANNWLNPPLRFSNEPVRHKLLDLIGDLSLVQRLPIAHYMAYKASHQLHTRLAHQLARAPVSAPAG